MKIIYFPFTFLSETSLAKCLMFFKRINLLSVLPDTALDHLTPWTEDDVVRTFSCKEDRIGIPDAESFFSRMGDNVASGADSLENIRKEILGERKPGNVHDVSAEDDKDLSGKLSRAFFFLRYAHDYDARNDQIDRRIVDFEHAESDILKELTGDDTIPSVPDHRKETGISRAATYMIEERLAAWAHVFLNSGHAGNDDVMFLTDCSEAGDYITEYFTGVEKICETGDVLLPESLTDDSLAWREELEKAIGQVLCRPSASGESRSLTLREHPCAGSPDGKKGGCRLTLSEICGVSPGTFMAKLAGAKASGSIPSKRCLLAVIS